MAIVQWQLGTFRILPFKLQKSRSLVEREQGSLSTPWPATPAVYNCFTSHAPVLYMNISIIRDYEILLGWICPS